MIFASSPGFSNFQGVSLEAFAVVWVSGCRFLAWASQVSQASSVGFPGILVL